MYFLYFVYFMKIQNKKFLPTHKSFIIAKVEGSQWYLMTSHFRACIGSRAKRAKSSHYWSGQFYNGYGKYSDHRQQNLSILQVTLQNSTGLKKKKRVGESKMNLSLSSDVKLKQNILHHSFLSSVYLNYSLSVCMIQYLHLLLLFSSVCSLWFLVFIPVYLYYSHVTAVSGETSNCTAQLSLC